jgi:predicted ATP-grasp superfamily ATP-dependent carboligase
MPRPLRILLTEGSSLSARQTLYALGRCGYEIDLCDPKPWLCLGRFSRYVRAVYSCPRFSVDPDGYLQFLGERLRDEHYDVLFPSHDQVFLLSRFRHVFEGRTGLPVPDFEAMLRLQGKAEFLQTLDELGLPHPPTWVVRERAALESVDEFPFYLKVSYSTAGRGVYLISNDLELRNVIGQLEQRRLLDGSHDLLIQEPVAGTLSVVQSVFSRGELVAAHCYQARALGVGGSARARISVKHPEVVEHVRALGARLRWHGALALDYLLDLATGRPSYIDANPRIGETFNALESGVNLCDLLARIAIGEHIFSVPPPTNGVRTHNLLMSLLALGEQGASRRRLLAEIWQAWRKQGLYAGSQDEMARPCEDPPSVFPTLFVGLGLLVRPRLAHRLIRNTVENYSLSAGFIRQMPGMVPGAW